MTGLRETKARLERRLAPLVAAARRLRSPRRARADVAAATELLERARREQLPVAQLVEAASRVADLGRVDLAGELFDHAVRISDGAPAALLGRRRLPGFVGDVPPATLARAAAAALDVPVERVPSLTSVRVTTVGSGISRNVEAVVRHHLPQGVTMIRKTIRAEPGREIRVYRSGVLDGGGRWWRSPRLYLAEREAPERWHLFLEDVGRCTPPRSRQHFLAAARALGELNGARITGRGPTGHRAWRGAHDRRPVSFARPHWARRRLSGVVGDLVRSRVELTLEALATNEQRIAAAVADLPTAFCHGDPHPRNLCTGTGRVVLLDWGAASLAPVGTDLGHLLGVPGRAVPPELVAECLAAYRAAADVAGAALSARDVELGYRSRFVSNSIERQLIQLPKARPAGRLARLGDAARLAWTGQRRSRIESNLHRGCDEAEALLDLVG